jgi:histone acetyltransferase HTATIP
MLRKAALKAAASVAGRKRKADDGEGTADDDEDAEGEDDEAGAVVAVEMVDDDADAEGEPDTPNGDSSLTSVAGQGKPPHFSKEQEIEKLRTSGSMTQSHAELSRVKNLDKIQIGKHEVEAWYFSPYPKESVHDFLITSRLASLLKRILFF